MCQMVRNQLKPQEFTLDYVIDFCEEILFPLFFDQNINLIESLVNDFSMKPQFI